MYLTVFSFMLHFRPWYSCCGATGATRGNAFCDTEFWACSVYSV